MRPLAFLPPTKRTILLQLATFKAAQFTFIILVYVLLPDLFKSTRSLASLFTTWDTQHYLVLSLSAYEPGAARNAFYPLWPFLIAVSAPILGGDRLLAALLLSNICSLIGLLLFHQSTQVRYGTVVANDAMWLLLAFPGSLYFAFPYSESVFFLLIISFFRALENENLKCLLITSFLLPLTKAIGVFCIPIIFLTFIRARVMPRKYFVCTAPIAGYVTYLLLMYALTGSAFGGFTAQAQFPTQPSIAKLLDWAEFARTLVDVRNVHDAFHSLLDRVWFVMLLIALPCVYRVDKGYFLYTILAGIIPAITNSFMSYTRYLAVIFPAYTVYAMCLRKRDDILLRCCVLSILFAVQLVFLIRHISGRWAS